MYPQVREHDVEHSTEFKAEQNEIYYTFTLLVNYYCGVVACET